MRVRAIFVGVLLASASSLGANARLSMHVSPSVAFAPASLAVRATVAADEENRAIEIVFESEDFYRSSEIQLDGKRAPRTTLMYFRSVPSGEYAVRALLKGPGGRERALVQSNVTVIETDPMGQ